MLISPELFRPDDGCFSSTGIRYDDDDDTSFLKFSACWQDTWVTSPLPGTFTNGSTRNFVTTLDYKNRPLIDHGIPPQAHRYRDVLQAGTLRLESYTLLLAAFCFSSRRNREMAAKVTVEEVRKAQRAEGPASVLAIGTVTPPNCVYQADYADYYFRVTKSEHMTELKEKFKRICRKSMIQKRYMHLTEDILLENPNMASYSAPSLNARQDILVEEVPKLGAAAAEKALKEWGQPRSQITHIIFCTTSGVDMPGADSRIIKLLGLDPSVKRVMLYHQGCFAGGMVLRIAKDLAENNRGARVLIVCSEITVVTFRGPSEAHLDSLVGQALFGDGAAAVIVGADPDEHVERPLFQMVSASETILPNSDGAIEGHLREVGLTFHLQERVPELISSNIERLLEESFKPLGISDWNSIFWVAHPGGPAILNAVESKAGIDKARLRATRQVLSEYGNMSSACVLFILDEMRKFSAEDGRATTGEGMDWGVLFGFGPGLTVETVVLHSVPITTGHAA